jgi:hypothetical protein
MDPLSSVTECILDGIIETAFNLIKETYSSIHGVKKDVERLSSNLTSIKARLEDAEKKQVNNQQLKDWLGKIKEAALDAEDILETFAAEAYHWNKQQSAVRNCLPSLGKASSKYHTAKKIKDISKRFDIIAEEKEKFHLDNILDNGGRSATLNNTGFLVDKSNVVGREADEKKITQMLLSNAYDVEGDVSVIPIIGMGGLGKTTLAQLVFNNERVSAHFENSRMWVRVTAEFDLKRILKEMIQFHSTMKLDDSSISHLQAWLLELLSLRRFLLVLDDVWTEEYEEWDSLRVLLKQGAKGSRVLVTSRSSKVGEVTGTPIFFTRPPPFYSLEYLPDDDCWTLFAKIVFGNIGTTLPSETRKDLEDIGREIVRKCQRLPLAVKAMGGILRRQYDVSKWRRIQSSEIWAIEDKLKVMAILKFSYDHVPSYLKRCFEYCSLFPKSHAFCKEDLVKLWIAQGFVQSSGIDTMEAGIAYFDDLFNRSFFQSSSIDNKEIYIMHDLIHGLAQSVSSPSCYKVEEDKLRNFSEQSRHVSLLVKNVEQPMLEIVNNATKLRSLLLPDSIEADSSGGCLKNFGQALRKVFKTLKYMRALDLSSTHIKVLPDSIEELKLLRYLNLSRTEIKVLPNSICNLFNLQTLKLLGCIRLSCLPKDLGNLVNLRHLELDDMFWFKLSMLPPSMGNVTGLHNLPVFQVGDENGYGIEQLEKMAYLLGTLHISKLEKAVNARDAKLNEKESLDKLVFEWSDDRVVNTQDEATEKSILEDLQPHPKLTELQIIRYRGNEFPAWMREGRLHNLRSLTLNGCIKCKTLALGQLTKLRALYIKGMQELEKWTEVEIWHSLLSLKLSNCPDLRELPSIFPKYLRVLKIKSCNSLRALPQTPCLKSLILIDNLILEDWNVVNPVQNLKVIGCPKLQALPEIFCPQKLEISRCDLLTTLPPPTHARRLQHLALDGCHDGALVRAIPDTSCLYSLVVSSISNISSFPKWPQLPGLKALFIRDCKDLVSLSNGEEGSLRTLTSLQLFSIRNCQMLETLNEDLPTSLEFLSIASCPLLKSFSLENLPSLRDLYIEDCPMLQSLPEDGLPSSLKHLQIKTCPLLTERCQREGGGGPDWQKISEIPDLEIDSHIVVPSTSVRNRRVWYRHFLCCIG